MVILELGCGGRKACGAIGVDKRSLPLVDIVHDLDEYPYPFDDKSTDIVIMSHVLEHLVDRIKAIEEVWRILKVGGIFRLRVPRWDREDAYRDPTHRWFFTKETMDYFDPEKGLGKSHGYYSHAKFKIVRFEERNVEYYWELKKLEADGCE